MVASPRIAAASHAPRVLVGTPTTSAKRYALAWYAWTIQHLTYPSYDILIVDNTDDDGEYARLMTNIGLHVVRAPVHDNPFKRLVGARNILRQYAIDNGYDYFLSLESDVIPPLDVIERMLSRGALYLTAVQWSYHIRGSDRTGWKIARCSNMCRQATEGPRAGKYYEIGEEEFAQGDLIAIDRSHMGCALIRIDLLHKIVFRFIDDDEIGTQYDDYLLCDDLRALGVELLCDTTIKLVHMTDGTLHADVARWRASAKAAAKDSRDASDLK